MRPPRLCTRTFSLASTRCSWRPGFIGQRRDGLTPVAASERVFSQFPQPTRSCPLSARSLGGRALVLALCCPRRTCRRIYQGNLRHVHPCVARRPIESVVVVAKGAAHARIWLCDGQRTSTRLTATVRAGSYRLTRTYSRLTTITAIRKIGKFWAASARARYLVFTTPRRPLEGSVNLEYSEVGPENLSVVGSQGFRHSQTAIAMGEGLANSPPSARSAGTG